MDILNCQQNFSKLTLICPFGVSGGIQVTTIVEDESGRTSMFLGADSISAKGMKIERKLILII
jgi:hypothetical protein